MVELERVRHKEVALCDQPEAGVSGCGTVSRSDGFLKEGSFQKMVGKIFRGK